jgi:hypothetical protein
MRTADELAQIPEFGKFHKQLINPQIGDTAELKAALAQYVWSCPTTNQDRRCLHD